MKYIQDETGKLCILKKNSCMKKNVLKMSNEFLTNSHVLLLSSSLIFFSSEFHAIV